MNNVEKIKQERSELLAKREKLNQQIRAIDIKRKDLAQDLIKESLQDYYLILAEANQADSSKNKYYVNVDKFIQNNFNKIICVDSGKVNDHFDPIYDRTFVNKDSILNKFAQFSTKTEINGFKFLPFTNCDLLFTKSEVEEFASHFDYSNAIKNSVIKASDIKPLCDFNYVINEKDNLIRE